MSWASGSKIFEDIIHVLKETVPDYETRVEIYGGLIEIFENADCDNLYEVLNEDHAFDAAYFELHPDEDELKENWDDIPDEDLDD